MATFTYAKGDTFKIWSFIGTFRKSLSSEAAAWYQWEHQCQIYSVRFYLKLFRAHHLFSLDVSTNLVWKTWVVTSEFFHALSERFSLQNHFEKTCLSSNVFFQQELSKPLAEWKWRARMTHLDKQWNAALREFKWTKMKSEWKKKEWLSMEALTEVNEMYSILRGLIRNFKNKCMGQKG